MAVTGSVLAGRYRIVRLLGVGGMGQVWLAEDQTLRRQVAIKEVTIPAGISRSEQEDLADWTMREAQAAAQLNHPNVVRIYDVGVSADQVWIVMEYVPSRSLLEVINEEGPLPARRVARIGLAVLSALTAAHRAGVRHHDVKPSNVLIAHDDRVVLTDFGSAVMDGGDGSQGGGGVIFGSPHYVAPERVYHRSSTPESDLWSLGATLYHAVEGRPPYDRGSVPVILSALAGTDPDPIVRAGPLAPVLTGLLQRDPRERMRPDEVRQRLTRVAGAPLVPRPRGPYPAPARRAGRGLSAVAAVLLLAGLAMLAATVSRQPPPGPAQSAPTQSQPPDVMVVPTAPPQSPAALPRGFAWWTGDGFRVAVPVGWSAERTTDGSMLFRSADRSTTLRVRSWRPAGGDVVSALVEEEARTTLPDYRRRQLERLPSSSGVPDRSAAPDAAGQADQPGVTWQYTYRDGKFGRMRGMDRVVMARGVAYRLQWRTPVRSWAKQLSRLDVVVRTFEPGRGSPVGS